MSFLINAGTYGIPFWSSAHCGIIGGSPDEPDTLLLYHSEVRTKIPCAVRKVVTQGIQAATLDYIEDQPGVIWHYPLKKPANLLGLTPFLVSVLGKPYDVIGALSTGKEHTENLDAMFCSELVAAALRTVDLFPIDNAGAWSPNNLFRTLVRMGVYHKPERLK